METFLMYLLFIVGVVLIVKGGDWFVGRSDQNPQIYHRRYHH